MSFSAEDELSLIRRYTERYGIYGYDPKTLGWDKGKQNVRFEVLTSQYNFENKHILDIGCGFGDINLTLSKKTNNYSYTGIDLVDSLLHEAGKRYKGAYIQFQRANILSFNSDRLFDYAISSGVFNHKLQQGNNYEFIEEALAKALTLVKDGIAFDFLSDKVDYKLEHTFHSSPEKILAIAYKYSRNIVLRNDYMPFEFSLFVFKDDSFDIADTLFNRIKNVR